MKRVEELAWNFDPKTPGFEWNEDACQDYQRPYPEVFGREEALPRIYAPRTDTWSPDLRICALFRSERVLQLPNK